MTRKNEDQNLARALQAETGSEYQNCLRAAQALRPLLQHASVPAVVRALILSQDDSKTAELEADAVALGEATISWTEGGRNFEPDGSVEVTWSPALWTVAHRASAGRLELWCFAESSEAWEFASQVALDFGLAQDPQYGARAVEDHAAGNFAAVLQAYRDTSPARFVLEVRPAWIQNVEDYYISMRFDPGSPESTLFRSMGKIPDLR